MKQVKQELPIITKSYNLVKYYVPILNRLPKSHKFMLGDRIILKLYDLLENLIKAKYSRNKVNLLEEINLNLDLMRYQTQLLLDFELIGNQSFEEITRSINEIGVELRNWINQQKN